MQMPLTSGPKGWPSLFTREGEGQAGGESRWRPNHMAGRTPLGELPT
jgi:hypothetical protein